MAPRELAVVPAPRRWTAGDDHFLIGADTTIGAEPGLEHLVSAFVRDVERDGGPRLVVSGADAAAIVVRIGPESGQLAALPDPMGASPSGRPPRGEGGSLRIARDGVSVTASAAEGVRHALTTLRQLIAAAALDGLGRRLVPQADIDDMPAVAWRGLSLDVARAYFGVTSIERIIEMLGLYKCNVLHLHLTDHEAWRLQSGLRPELTAGMPAGSFLTRDEFIGLCRLAASRGVTVVPEVDVPGHSSAAARAVPQLAGPEGIGDPQRFALDPRLPETVPFLRDVFSGLAELAPGPFLHIGGDETLGMHPERYREFMEQLLPFVRSTGKRVIGWQEVVRAGMRSGDLMQYWVDIGEEDLGAEAQTDSDETTWFREVLLQAPLDLERARRQGVGVILSPISAAYFDTAFADEVPPPQREVVARFGYPAYAPRSLQDFYEWRPLEVLPDAQMLAGVEAVVWGELLREATDLDLLILPRLPGFAERGWSPESRWQGYRERVAGHAATWRAHGWQFIEATSIPWDRPPRASR